jgi:hypothetical protein
VSSEYDALRDKVGAFTRVAFERRRADMACKAGCDACCRAWLSVSAVEADAIRRVLAALPAEARARVAERGANERRRQRDADTTRAPRCAMLEPDGRCAIYAARPLLCLTQGHALRYPPGFVPGAAVRMRAPSGDVTHCPLNFTRAAPAGEDVLDAERVDQLLAVVNHRFARARGVDPNARFELTELAIEGAALGEPPPSC